ncbi:MAG: hypothetical protein JXA82_06285 [Sedimentisphaerales bacterium]|nr:hypothetical protein [Sedimentisphaerales bacterium]
MNKKDFYSFFFTWGLFLFVLIPQVQAEDSTIAVVLIPKTVYAGSDITVSLTTLNASDNSPVSSTIQISLWTDQTTLVPLFSGKTDTVGRLSVTLNLPDLAPHSYTLQLDIEGVDDPLTAQIQLRKLPVLLIETDKPIYKPGQTMHGRILTLTNQVRPQSTSVEVQITDGKGIKIFHKALTSNAFGVASFDVPLATELNLGTWKISAQAESASSCVDIRVEKYVLPRFQVDLETLRDYFLVDEEITGQIKANYFFGQIVEGTVVLHASRYVGAWEEYATYSADLVNGKVDFTLHPVGYIAGTHSAGGAGTVQLEAIVTDPSGHEEKTTKILKIVDSTIHHGLIARSRNIVPGSPFQITLIAENQEGYPVTASAQVECEYFNQEWQVLSQETKSIPAFTGSTSITFHAPKDTAWAHLTSTAQTSEAMDQAELTIYASTSPTDSFISLSRSSDEPASIGDTIEIDVLKTHPVTVYYDIFARGHTVWSGFTREDKIHFQVTPQMFPLAKVVAYIINPNNEISADSLSFDVSIENLTNLDVHFNKEQALPGEELQLSLQAEEQAMVGLAIVDESVYALNEGRLTMTEVFKELERLFMEPQIEEHPYEYNTGAGAVFDEANIQVITSSQIQVPQGPWFWNWDRWLEDAVDVSAGGNGKGEDSGLAEVTRVRQFFPETWVWMPELLTNPDGTASLDLTAPDSITTWRIHAVSTSDKGLGMVESSLLVFQEFFGEPDLPYAVTRGEQFPLRIQIYNYLDEPQSVQVSLTTAEWFDLLDPAVQYIDVAANAVSMASFTIRPIQTGQHPIEITLRSPLRADAVRKELLVEPEGTQRELVTNGMIKADQTIQLDAIMPDYRVPDSEKILLNVTPSLVAQSINGVEDLLGMPYGCGEQNMIFMAPDIEILHYLDATGQLTPEIRAKAEHFITVGYQRELTYRRDDGSFSAFGNSDQSGSLWLTAFVLDVFSGAKDIQAIDEGILTDAAAWIEQHQKQDGSWESVGFIHHREMIGGMSGDFALTAFVLISLLDYGQATPVVIDQATTYLTDNLTTVQEDPYALAIASLALAKQQNPAAQMILDRLLELAISDENGLHWEPHGVETTAYAGLAMMEYDMPQANEVIKWISLQQNSRGGFGQTQDTVMGLKILMTAARKQTRDVDLTIIARQITEEGTGPILAELHMDETNFDVLQIAELPSVDRIELIAAGSGEVKFQLVRRFHVLLDYNCIENEMRLEVTYDTKTVEVDDIVNVTATVRYLGPEGKSGMMIVDVGVPTGFSVVTETLDALVETGLVSRTEVAGRKVIFYIDGLSSGEQRTLTFQVKARFPVRAIVPDSSAYLYYKPQARAEAKGETIVVQDLQALQILYLGKLEVLGANWLRKVQDSPSFDYYADGMIDMQDLAVLATEWLKDSP